MISLSDLNALPPAGFAAALGGIFEHSPWIPQQVAPLRPFSSGIKLLQAMCEVVTRADAATQLSLIRVHPELTGRATVAGTLTAASNREQRGAGLSECTPDQHQQLLALNGEYTARFGFPFVLAVKGHTPATVIARLASRLRHSSDEERGIALREIGRIARFRLAELVAEAPGAAILAMADELAGHSDSDGMLTCAYLTPAHIATAGLIHDYMLAAGLAANIDAVGNVVGRLPAGDPTGPHLVTGSHYDTVTNAGRYDGRLGILLPIVVAGALRRAGTVLPCPLEIVAFADEEGARFKSTFLGSRAVIGRFETSVLESRDAAGTSLHEALLAAGHDPDAIGQLARKSGHIADFIEVHIEQGPVLLDAAEPVGVVTSIAGSVRLLVVVLGRSGHAGTVPMAVRHDAAAAAAEMILAVEDRCNAPELVGTVGQLNVPGGAINVIPGCCEFSIDVRSGDDTVRDAAVADLETTLRSIAQRRGVQVTLRSVLEVHSAPCAQRLQDAWSASAERITGRRPPRLASGAGHDAMMLANIADIGMLFVRCGNGGISHHPDETLSAADAETAARVFEDFLLHYELPEPGHPR